MQHRYILTCAAIWTAASVVKKIIFDEMDFPYPFVICVFANSCYVTQFLNLAVRRLVERFDAVKFGIFKRK